MVVKLKQTIMLCSLCCCMEVSYVFSPLTRSVRWCWCSWPPSTPPPSQGMSTQFLPIIMSMSLSYMQRILFLTVTGCALVQHAVIQAKERVVRTDWLLSRKLQLSILVKGDSGIRRILSQLPNYNVSWHVATCRTSNSNWANLVFLQISPNSCSLILTDYVLLVESVIG